ncbi:MAG: hypothetical protein ACE5GV_17095 [Candidatus Scalindua sp.]
MSFYFILMKFIVLKALMEKKMQEYYVYHNWTAEKGGKAIIHASNCSFCNNGQGIHNSGFTKNGKWLGPFATKQQAVEAANKTGAKRIAFCKFG